MRTLSATEQALLQSGAYAVHCRVLVRDAGGIFRDLSMLAGTDWVVEARWDDDIDFPVAQAEVTLWREGAEGSLSPFVGSSPFNAGGPLLDAGREIRIETAVTPPGVAPAAGDWRLVFEGYIDNVSFGRRESRVTIQARDLGGLLLDTWIEEEAVYGSEEGTPVEVVMQQILDATLGAEVVQLVVPQSPGFLITPYTQEPMALLEALQRLADLIGWTVRYRWHEPSGAFRLTFYEPPRDATVPVWTFGPDDYLDVADLNIDRAGVRNVIEVSYRDAASGERKRVTASDAQSVARYGRRWMQIQEADTSPIDSAEEAQALADAALADLAQPKAEQEIELHYWWPVELHDLYRFMPNGVHYDEAQDLAVVSWRHELAADRARTFIRTRGRPAGAYRRWYRETRDWLAAPAVTPTLDEDDGVLYLHPNRNEHCGSVRWAVSTSGPPTLAQVRAGPLSTAHRIQVHVFGGAADERVWVGVLPLRHPDGTGGEGALVTLPYTHRIGAAIAPALTWFPIAPSAPDKDAVRIVANDDGDQVALYYRTYSKGSTPPAFTRVPASGFLPDPITLDVEVATPAKGQPNIVVEAYAEDDEGHTTPRRVVIELDHGEEPSGEVVLEVDADGRVYVQVSSTDSDTGSARFRAVRGSVTTPTYEALTFVDDTDPADGKTERGISLAEFGTRIDTGIVLDQFQAAYVVVQFFRTLSSLGAAQQGSRASAEIRSWRAMTAVRPPRANIRVVDATRTSETLEYQGILGPLGVGPLQYRRRVIDQDVEGAWGPGSGDGWASMPPSGFPQQTIQRGKFWSRTVELQVRDAHLQVAEARHTIAPELPALDDETGTVRPGSIRDEHYSSAPADKLATVKVRLPPIVEVEVLSSTDYQSTFRITARDADGGQVRIWWRVVSAPSESYTTPTPTSSGALQPQPFTMNVTVDRDANVDTLFEVWSEDEDGNRSAIARRTIPRIVAPENALTNVNAALFALGSTCPSQLVDRVTWTRDPAVPASWRVEVWIIEGTTTGDPFSGTPIASNATSPFNTTRLSNVRTGSTMTYNRRYGVRLINSRGSVVREVRPLGLSTGYEICPI